MTNQDFKTISAVIQAIGSSIYEAKLKNLESFFTHYIPNKEYRLKLAHYGLPKEMHFSSDFKKEVLMLANEIVKSFTNANLPLRTVVVYWGMESDFVNYKTCDYDQQDMMNVKRINPDGLDKIEYAK